MSEFHAWSLRELSDDHLQARNQDSNDSPQSPIHVQDLEDLLTGCARSLDTLHKAAAWPVANCLRCRRGNGL